MGISQFLTVAANTVSGKAEPSMGVVVATGLILVFGVLVLLYLIIVLEGVIFKSIDSRKNGNATVKAAAPAPAPQVAPAVPARAPVVEAGIPGEVVAAIAAAVACMDGGEGYVIRSLKRARTGRSAWAQAGAIAGTEPF